ncbi:hypothetical protein AWB64_00952 [Caballeronia sordidicola]|uniref:Uncharacterized protein n=1 Tax=Caballeronia sordidicola TaxID=196367 RepID=A0A158FA51_CABSO|nr:hypothetical protein [Caballeronia sordidicola]SAL16209.1 hypothetical protein AWB64_00952 [Caballeronia sordidicola]
MIQDIFTFLLPRGEFLQVVFSSVMGLLLAFTIVGVRLSANERRWETNWHRRTDSAQTDVLAAEYGSSHELSDIVATRWEKLADIMPGILLILGLLGTFLGLGIALNKASYILQHSNAASVSMDDTMENLKGMMEGLGTKFKTSTWGIMAFLALKAWTVVNGYEDRRLRWCVATLKTHAAEVARLQTEEKARAEDRLVTTLETVGERIVGGLMQMDEQRRAESAEHAALLQRLNEAASASVAGTATTHEKLDAQTQQFSAIVGAAMQRVAAHMQQHDERRQAEFAEHSRMLIGLTDVSRAGVAATKAIHGRLDAQTEQISVATTHAEHTRTAIEDFVKANIENIDRLGEAGETMSTAAQAMSGSADQLQVAIGELQQQIVSVLGDVKEGLANSIASMNGSFHSNLNDMSTKLAATTDGIRDSVTLMSTNVDKTLDKMGVQLETATEGIRTSVSQLSSSVSQTLDKVSGTVEGAINDSAKLQAETSFSLSALTDALSESVTESTEMIKNLAEPIQLGLTSVSEGNVRMSKIFEEISRRSAPAQRIKAAPERARRTTKTTTERTRRASLS